MLTLTLTLVLVLMLKLMLTRMLMGACAHGHASSCSLPPSLSQRQQGDNVDTEVEDCDQATEIQTSDHSDSEMDAVESSALPHVRMCM